MTNPIAPHTPPVGPGSPGRPASAGLAGKPGTGAPFDDYLSDDEPSSKVPIIDDHSPPVDPDEPRSDDPVRLRPMRENGSKEPVANTTGTPVAGVNVPLPPTMDLRTALPAIALSSSWSLLGAPSEAGPSTGTEAGSLSGTSMGNSPTVDFNADAPGDGLPASIGSTSFHGIAKRVLSTRGKSDHAPLAPASTISAALDTGFMILPPGKEAVAPGRLPLAGTDLDATPGPTPSGGGATPASGNTRPGQAAVQPPVASGAAPAPGLTVDAAAAPAAEVAGVGETNTPASTAALSAPGVVSVPTHAGLSAPPSAQMPPVVTTPASPVPVATSIPGSRVEISGMSAPKGAKIADPAAREVKSARSLEKQNVQDAGIESLKPEIQPDGTTVAKHEVAVTLTPTRDNTEADTALPPKRTGAAADASTSNPRTGSAHPAASETFVGTAVTGVSTVAGATSQVAEQAPAEPTAARQVARVETLLQNTLSVGQSIRPNGSSQLEMRVRLDGGSGDVTVRMQVTDDRMQVTFQTDSPALRKALEHGWQQFSADAAQSSTLALSEPRFEAAAPVGSAVQNGFADTAAFTGQQNSRRQETDVSIADDDPTPGGSLRGGFSAVATGATVVPRRTGRGWSGWA